MLCRRARGAEAVRVGEAEESEGGGRAGNEEIDEEGLRKVLGSWGERERGRTSFLVTPSMALWRSSTSQLSGPMSKPLSAYSTARGLISGIGKRRGGDRKSVV